MMPAVRHGVLDMYRVERVIGRGGTGVVLLATDERLEREVAIKVIAPDRMGNAKAHELPGEARAMACEARERRTALRVRTVRGPPLLRQWSTCRAPPRHWIDERATRGVSPSIDETLGILDQACRGLGAIHERGVVHADVKPGNVLIVRFPPRRDDRLRSSSRVAERDLMSSWSEPRPTSRPRLH
ncbi:MAG: hypothetical protein R3B99_16080 [Polyangiales bacterium]